MQQPLFFFITSDPHHIRRDLRDGVCAAHLHGVGQLTGQLINVALHAFLAAAIYSGGGEEGVKCYIDKIAAELADTMQMCGAHSLAEITRDMVRI